MRIQTLTDKNATKVAKEIETAVSQIGENYGLNIKLGKMRHSEYDLKISNLSMSTLTKPSKERIVSREPRNLKDVMSQYHVRSVQGRKGETLIRATIRGKARPFIYKSPGGREYRISAEEAQKRFGESD